MATASTVAVTIVFTDLVGSTALGSTLSTEQADELRRAYFGLLRDAVAATGGTEVKNLGDGLMIAFNSSIRALACAVRMQQATERHNARSPHLLSVRVGMASGEATEEDGDFFGDVVVEAARLCAAAEGGQILATDVVRALVGRHAPVELAPLGELQLKGIPQPVPTVEVRWSTVDRDGGVPLPDRLVVAATQGLFSFFGRAAEVEAIAAACKRSSAGLEVVLVAGEPGIGKTALSAQVARNVHANGGVVLFGGCDEVVAAPYQPWIAALSHLVEHSDAEAWSGLRPMHVAALRRLLPDATALPSSEVVSTEPDTERFLLLEAIVSLLAATSRDETVVIVLEDLHWADAATIDAIRHLVHSRSTVPAVVLATYRDSEVSRGTPLTSLLADLWRESCVTRIHLHGLGDTELIELMEAAAGHDLPGEGVALAHAVHRETDGNPFFAVELLRHLAESGAFGLGDDGRYSLIGDIRGLALPTSVREVVSHRTARLGDDVVRVLSIAAVIGQEFDLDVLGPVAEVDEDRLIELLDRAATASLVVESLDVPGRYRFVHALIAHTLSQELGATRRQRAHHRIAETLEAAADHRPARIEELARHWLAATRPAEADKALHYVKRAGDAALAALAPLDAISWFTQGLDLLDRQPTPDERERGFLLAGLAQAQIDAGSTDRDATVRLAHEVARRVGDAELLVTVALCGQAGLTDVSLPDPDRIALFEAALDAVGTAESATRARLLNGMAEEVDRRDWRRRRELIDEAIAMVRRLDDPTALLEVLARSMPQRIGPDTHDELKADALVAVDLARHAGDSLALFNSLAALLHCAVEEADIDRAEECFAELRALNDQTGIPYHQWRIAMTDSFFQLLAGDTEAAERSTNAAFELGVAIDWPPAASTYGAQLMMIRTHQGRLDEVVDLAAQGVEDFETLPGWNAALAVLYADLGRIDELRAIFDPAAATGFSGIPYDATWLLAMACWADCAASLGRADVAPLLIERLHPFASRVIFTTAHTLGAVGRSLGRLQVLVGAYDAAERSLRGALEVHQRLRAPYWTARTKLDLADALAARNDPGDNQRADMLVNEAVRTADAYACDGLRTHARYP